MTRSMPSKTANSLPARLGSALAQLTPGRPEAVDTLRALYADDIVFRDPIQTVHGIDDFVAMNHRLLRRMRDLEWIVQSVAGDESEIFLEWTMRGRPKLGPKVKLDGMTRARARNGCVFDHRDYWDLGELLASSIPGGPRLLRAILSPLA